MKSYTQTLALALASAALLAGCGKPQTETQPGASEPAAPAAPEAGQPSTPASFISPTVDTNEAPTGAAAFQSKSLASPFAQAELGLKESFNRALIAFQIGDYARAVSELQDLAETPDLNPQQQQAVQDLLAETLKLAPELAATNTTPAAATRKAQPPTAFPLATTEPAQSPKNSPESPFSTADPAVKDSFARAKAAYDIGNYERALVELRDLATNNQLNWQQKYAVQALLDKTPQRAPAQSPGPAPTR
jgi:hypothetical protein